MSGVSPISRRRFAQRAASGLAAVAVGSRCGWAMPEKAARPFKLSVMLWTLRPKYTAEQAIDLVAGAGYDGFELVDEDKKWSAADVGASTRTSSNWGLRAMRWQALTRASPRQVLRSGWPMS